MVVKCMKKFFSMRSALEEVQDLFIDHVGFLQRGNATPENHRRRQLIF